MRFIPKPLCLLITITLTTVILTACKKENDQDIQAQQEEFANAATTSDAEAETMFNDVFDNVMGVNDEVAAGIPAFRPASTYL